MPVNALLLQKSKHLLVRFEEWCALSFLSRDVGLDTLCDPVSPVVLARVISCVSIGLSKPGIVTIVISYPDLPRPRDFSV